MVSRNIKTSMLKVAREAIVEFFDGIKSETYKEMLGDESMREENGVFVTLKKSGELRGCIGLIVSDEPVIESIRKMAIQAAFYDNRFPSLGKDELDSVEIEISLLTKPEAVAGFDEIEIGKDGIILSFAGRQSLFLPQVATEQGWGLETTLDHLSMKAGLPVNAWKNETCQFHTFQAEYFSESESEM